jgi:hypothetical protein
MEAKLRENKSKEMKNVLIEAEFEVWLSQRK